MSGMNVWFWVVKVALNIPFEYGLLGSRFYGELFCILRPSHPSFLAVRIQMPILRQLSPANLFNDLSSDPCQISSLRGEYDMVWPVPAHACQICWNPGHDLTPKKLSSFFSLSPVNKWWLDWALDFSLTFNPPLIQELFGKRVEKDQTFSPRLTLHISRICFPFSSRSLFHSFKFLGLT